MTKKNNDNNNQAQTDEKVQTTAEEVNEEKVSKEDVGEKDLKQALNEAEARAREYKDMLQRLQAEFDNYRKRTSDRAKESRFDGICDLVIELLPAIDNLERGLSLIADESAKSGMQMILKQLLEVLSKFDIEEVQALNQPFNPDIHHAVAKDEECNDDDETIVNEVFIKGYKRRKRVLRPCMVKVTNKK